MDDPAARIHTAGANLRELRPALVAREPWPLSTAYGTEPEADWGPREVLAHVNEMLGYWTTELQRVVAGEGAGEPVPFGRVATDPARLARIATDRARPVGELLDSVDDGLDRTARFADGLGPRDLDRVGVHPTRGELSVAASIDRFLITHLEEHVVQLRAIVDRANANGDRGS